MKIDFYIVIFIVFCILVIILWLFDYFKTKRKGIEAEAVISNVERKWEPSGKTCMMCYNYTVRYKNAEGMIVSAPLSGFGVSGTIKRFNCGDRIIIRYLPDHPKRPFYIKRLS